MLGWRATTIGSRLSEQERFSDPTDKPGAFSLAPIPAAIQYTTLRPESQLPSSICSLTEIARCRSMSSCCVRPDTSRPGLAALGLRVP